MRYVTLFSCDTFGFYVSWVYLQYGVQVVTRQFPSSSDPENTLDGAFVGIILALLMVMSSYLFRTASQSPYFHRHVRRFLADYGMPLSLVASSAMAYWGRFNHANPTTLPVGKAFQPAGGREWLVRFWQLEAKWVGIAFPFGFALWVLFFFDHNVSVSSSGFPCQPPLLTRSTVAHGSGEPVPSAETAGFPLRLLHPRNYDFHCGFTRYSCAQRSHPPSSYTYPVITRDGKCSQDEKPRH